MKKKLHELSEEDLARLRWSDEELEEFQNDFNLISSYQLPLNNDTYNELGRKFYRFASRIPIFSFDIQKEEVIIRARPNFNNEIFSEKWEISYNSRNTGKIEVGRFNKKKCSMFYGSINFSNKDSVSAFTCCLEACKELTKNPSPILEQYFTLSSWKVKRQMTVINLCYKDELFNKNPLLGNDTAEYIKMLNSYFDKTQITCILNFWSLLSNISCNLVEEGSEKEYFISNCFWDFTTQYYRATEQKYIDGIIYPSSTSGFEGVNVLLQPFSIDRNVDVQEVCMAIYKRDSLESTDYKATICSNIGKVDNDKFFITLND